MLRNRRSLTLYLAVGMLILSSCGSSDPEADSHPTPRSSDSASNDLASNHSASGDTATSAPNDPSERSTPSESAVVAPEASDNSSPEESSSEGESADVALEEPQSHGGYSSFAFSPDGAVVAGGTGVVTFSLGNETEKSGGEVLLWDSQTGSLTTTLGSHEASVDWLAFDSSGAMLVSISNEDAVAKAWDVMSKTEKRSIKLNGSYDINGAAPALAANGSWLAYVNQKSLSLGEQEVNVPGALAVYDLESGQEKWKLDDCWVESMAASPDGRYLAGYQQQIDWEEDEDGGARGDYVKRALIVWDAANGDIVWETEAGDHSPDQLLFTPDSSQLLLLEQESIAFVDPGSGDVLNVFELNGERSPDVVRLSPDGKRLGIIQFMGEKVQLWDLEQQSLINEWTYEFPDTLWESAWGPQLDRIATQQSHLPTVLALEP